MELGCENNQISSLPEGVSKEKLERVRYFNAQQGNDEIDAGIEVVVRILDIEKYDKCEPCPVFELPLGMKCG